MESGLSVRVFVYYVYGQAVLSHLRVPPPTQYADFLVPANLVELSAAGNKTPLSCFASFPA